MIQPPGELLQFLDTYQTYYLVSHIEPDGDCLASSLALGHFLERRGKSVVHLNEGPFFRPEIKRYEPLFHGNVPETLEGARDKTAVVVLDCSTPERVGGLADGISEFDIAVIDHHSSREEFGTVTYIDSRAPSTSVLVQEVIQKMDHVQEEEARHILFALGTDTGYFRHLDIGTGETFRQIGNLVDAGASPKDVYNAIYGGKSLESRILLGRLLSRVESFYHGEYLLTFETQDDIQELGRENRDSDTLYQLLMGTAHCHVIGLVREEPGGLASGSFRSNDETDVGSIAKSFGGGGHKRAAGFAVRRPWKEVLDEIRTLFRKRLNTG